MSCHFMSLSPLHTLSLMHEFRSFILLHVIHSCCFTSCHLIFMTFIHFSSFIRFCHSIKFNDSLIHPFPFHSVPFHSCASIVHVFHPISQRFIHAIITQSLFHGSILLELCAPTGLSSHFYQVPCILLMSWSRLVVGLRRKQCLRLLGRGQQVNFSDRAHAHRN